MEVFLESIELIFIQKKQQHKYKNFLPQTRVFNLAKVHKNTVFSTMDIQHVFKKS